MLLLFTGVKCQVIKDTRRDRRKLRHCGATMAPSPNRHTWSAGFARRPRYIFSVVVDYFIRKTKIVNAGTHGAHIKSDIMISKNEPGPKTKTEANVGPSMVPLLMLCLLDKNPVIQSAIRTLRWTR